MTPEEIEDLLDRVRSDRDTIARLTAALRESERERLDLRGHARALCDAWLSLRLRAGRGPDPEVNAAFGGLAEILGRPLFPGPAREAGERGES